MHQRYDVDAAATVFIVDDDLSCRRSLSWLLDSAQIPAEPYANAEDFLSAYQIDRPGCLLLDIRLPGMSGVKLQQELKRGGSELPVIILTAFGEVNTAVLALKYGAFDFIEKPCSDQLLIERVHQAIDLDRRTRRARQQHAYFAAQIARLTPREREVMDLVVAGKANKVVASDLGISEKTVEAHRAKVMRKLEVGSLAELVRLQLITSPSDALSDLVH